MIAATVTVEQLNDRRSVLHLKEDTGLTRTSRMFGPYDTVALGTPHQLAELEAVTRERDHFIRELEKTQRELDEAVRAFDAVEAELTELRSARNRRAALRERF